MGRSKPVVLDSVSFDKQGQAMDFFKAMLNRYIPGERVNDEDARHLRNLLKRHPNYAEKVGDGINHFEVIPADYGSQCFCVVRVDETREDFSYKKCVTQTD